MEDAVRIFRLVATEFDVLNDETVEAWLNPHSAAHQQEGVREAV
ncbi:MAG: hypothetical protein ACLUGP_04060 [Faecalibacterium prausnitzii]